MATEYEKVTRAKTPLMLRTEVRLGRPLEEIIIEKYEELGSLEKVGEVLGIKPNTLYLWMLRLGITRRVTLGRPGDNGSEENDA